MESMITAKAHGVASTSGGCALMSRLAASQITTPARTNSIAVATSAETLSILPWP
jgi:hypothetical protein